MSPSYPTLLGAAVPCQPYWRQGSGTALADAGPDVLGSVLLFAWQLQFAGLVLECIAEVADCSGAIQAIRRFANKMGLDFVSDQWSSHTRRWWAILMPKRGGRISLAGLGSVKLPEWPIEGAPTVDYGLLVAGAQALVPVECSCGSWV